MNRPPSNQPHAGAPPMVGSRSGFAATAILASVAGVLALGFASHAEPEGSAGMLPPPSTAEVREHLRALIARGHRPVDDLRAFDQRFGPGQSIPFTAALRRESLIRDALDPIDGDL